MAKKDLDAFAKYLEQQIAKDVQEYRLLIADWEPHTIKIVEEEVKNEARDALRDILGLPAGAQLSNTFEEIIERDVAKLCKRLWDSFGESKTTQFWEVTAELDGNPQNFTFRVAQRPGVKKGKQSVFGYIRSIKQEGQRDLINNLDNAILADENIDDSKRLKRRKTITTKSGAPFDILVPKRFLDIGHDQDTTVVMARSRATKRALDTYKFSTQEAEAYAKRVLGTGNRYWLQVSKKPGKGKNEIAEFSASLEAFGNNAAKAYTDALNSGSIQRRLDLLVEKGAQKFATQPGSDSPVDVIEKRLLNQFHEIGSQKKKHRKTNIKKQKINNKPSTGKSKVNKPKSVKSRKYTEKAVTIGKSGGKAGSRASKSRTNVRMLLGPLQQKINSQVLKNMEAPALENRTGRFAASVRITDIAVTSQGFPSVGYTYQKSPYQTFEKGYAQGSAERDPRTLIDRSIREIAAELAVGRFYTRRV